jgi:hypothetical protein
MSPIGHPSRLAGLEESPNGPLIEIDAPAIYSSILPWLFAKHSFS